MNVTTRRNGVGAMGPSRPEFESDPRPYLDLTSEIDLYLVSNLNRIM